MAPSAASPSASARSLPKPMLVALWVTVGVTVLSWLFAYVCSRKGLPEPYSWPYYKTASLFHPNGDTFSDFTIFDERFQHFHTPAFFSDRILSIPFPYPAPVALLYRVFTPTFAHATSYALPVAVLCILVPAYLFLRSLWRIGLRRSSTLFYVAATLAFSAVIYFELCRLNTEIFVFVLIAAALHAFLSRRYAVTSVLLGLATALKLFPFILLGLLFQAKRYGAIALALGVAAIATLAGLEAESGNVALSFRGTLAGLHFFAQEYVLRFNQLSWDHSLFCIAKLLNFFGRSPFEVQTLYTAYLATLAVLCLLLFFLRIRNLPVFNQIASLVLLTVLVPPVSYEYTLLHVYSIFAIFCCIAARRHVAGGVCPPVFTRMAIAYGLIFSLVGFIIVRSVSLGGQVKSVALLVLLVLSLASPVLDAVPVAKPSPA